MKFIKIILILSLFVVSSYNILNIGILVKKSYDLATIRKELRAISEENRQNAIELSLFSSVDNAKNTLGEKSDFEKIGKVDYIKVGSVVAER